MRPIKRTIIEIFYQIGNLPITRLLMKRYRGNVSILMYHRVLPAEEIAKDKSPNADWVVSVTKFEEQIKYLSENYHVIPIGELPNHLSDFHKQSVVITFDDGYKDNLLYALPILKRHNVPAVIYIVTRFPEGDCTIWSYEVSEICESRKSLEFYWQGRHYYWDLTNRKQKDRCFQDLKSSILSLHTNDQLSLMQFIRNGEPTKNYPELCLTWEEIQQLDKEPSITIGAHTHTHVNLKKLMIQEARKEILYSKKLLEEKLGHTVEHFAYPYGTSNEADQREYNLARECAFKTAVTTLCQPMNKTIDLFRLPRYTILEKNGPFELDVKLSGWNAFFRKNM